MTVIVNKTKSGSVDLRTLQAEINANAAIVPSCISISKSGIDLLLEFAAALSPTEDTVLEAVIDAHVPPSQPVEVSTLSFSSIDGKKLSVHHSTKPDIDGVTVYTYWTGRGDDMTTGDVGGGDLLNFLLANGSGNITKEVQFHPSNGRVWLHEGIRMKYIDAGESDYATVDLVVVKTPLQALTNLDLVVDSNWIKAAPGGPGTGTHGWDDITKRTLIPRTFLKDGDWDLDSNGDLIENTEGTGLYKISDIDRIVHRLVNSIPLEGTTSFFPLTLGETMEIPANHKLVATVVNTSNKKWTVSIIMELYRELTIEEI